MSHTCVQVILEYFLIVDPVLFPDELSTYGLTMEALGDAFECSESEEVSWTLHGIPNVEFYRKLHLFLKKWSMTRSLTKTAIGKFYLAVDKQLQERRSSPYNTYRFIEQIVSSNVPDSALMSYGLDKQLGSLQAEIQDCREQVQDLTHQNEGTAG